MRDAPENILLIRFKSIGDVVLTLPAVNAVRENFPSAKVTFLTSAENAPLLRGFSEVNQVIALDRAAMKKPLSAFSEFFRLLGKLRGGKFSLVVDFQGYGETAWLARLTGARRRWGSVYGPGREWLYTRGVKRNERIHHADWNLSLLRQCGLRIGEIRNEFILPEDALSEARRFFAERRLIPGQPTFFLQPITSSPHKNWPMENYLAVARHFQARGAQIIFSGGPADHEALTPARAAGFVISAGVPLLVSAGLTKLAALSIGGDTGLLHLAVAMGRRVTMLMQSIAPGSPHPFQHADWAITPSGGRSVADIPVEKVLEAVKLPMF